MTSKGSVKTGMADKKNSLIIIICISSLLILNVFLALYNLGLFNGLGCGTKNVLVKVKIPHKARIMKNPASTTTTTTTTTTTISPTPTSSMPKMLKKHVPIKLTFAKMIKFVPKKLQRMTKNIPDFSSIPTPEVFDKIFHNEPPLNFPAIPLPGPLPLLNEGPIHINTKLPPVLGTFLTKLMPNIDEMVRDMVGPHEKSMKHHFIYDRPQDDCIFCTFEAERNSKDIPMGFLGDEAKDPKVTEVKAVLPESIFPESVIKPKKKSRHSLLIFMAPKKFGKDLGKMDTLPPFLPPLFQGDKLMENIQDGPLGGPIKEFSGFLPPSFPIHEAPEIPEKDLISMITDQLHDLNEPVNGELKFDNVNEEPISLKNEIETVKSEEDHGMTFVNKNPIMKPTETIKEDSIPTFHNLDFSPKTVQGGDDIEKLATFEKVAKIGEKSHEKDVKNL